MASATGAARTPQDYRTLYLENIRKIHFTRLLKAGYLTPADMEAGNAACELTFPGDYFTVICFNIEDIHALFFEQTEYDEKSLGTAFFIVENVAREMLAGLCHLYTAPTDSQIVFIVCATEAQTKGDGLGFCKTLVEKTGEIIDFIRSRLGLVLTAIVGELFVGGDGIGQAYQAARALRKYRKFMGETRPVLFCGDHSKIMEGSDSAAEDELHFVMALFRSVEADRLSDAAGDLERYIQEVFLKHRPTIQSCEREYYGLCQILFMASEAIRARHKDAYVDWLLRPEKLIIAKSVVEIQERMAAVLRQLDAYLHSSGAEAPPAWVNRVADYINENYENVNLNISTLANVFSMNPAYLSRTFKRCTGTGLLELINLRRLERAKALIAAGENIEETARKVGYGSTMTMRRYFKKYEGCAPSQLL